MLKTTVTGSLPKPAWLAQPEVLWAPWASDDPALLEEYNVPLLPVHSGG